MTRVGNNYLDGAHALSRGQAALQKEFGGRRAFEEGAEGVGVQWGEDGLRR